MAFHEVNKASRFGPELISLSRLLRQARESAATQAARATNAADDAQAQSIFGTTTLTKAQIVSTLEAVVTRLNDPSIDDMVEKIG